MKKSRTAPDPTADLYDVKAFEEYAIDVLRNAGYRITMPRVQVIRALADSKTALSAYGIHEKIINGGGKIDVVSVYRILVTLTSVGLIHHIGVSNGYYPNRIPESAKQTLVAVDRDTQEVVEIPLPPTVYEALAAQAREHGVELELVKGEIVGKVNSGGRGN